MSGNEEAGNAMNRRSSVGRILVRAVVLQAVVYAILACYGPCRDALIEEREIGLSIDLQQKIESLPSHQREAVERVLAGWSQQIERPGIPFGVYEPSPGCYTVRYTLRGDAKVWVMYDAHDRRIASQDND